MVAYPTDYAARPESTAEFSCAFNRDRTTLTVAWMKDGTMLGTDPRFVFLNTELTLSIDEVSYLDMGTYTCQATDGNGRRTQASAILSLIPG